MLQVVLHLAIKGKRRQARGYDIDIVRGIVRQLPKTSVI
jgi:hypothetical protein